MIITSADVAPEISRSAEAQSLTVTMGGFAGPPHRFSIDRLRCCVRHNQSGAMRAPGLSRATRTQGLEQPGPERAARLISQVYPAHDYNLQTQCPIVLSSGTLPSTSLLVCTRQACCQDGSKRADRCLQVPRFCTHLVPSCEATNQLFLYVPD